MVSPESGKPLNQQTEEIFRRHWDDLSETAREVLERLLEVSRYVPLPRPVVCEFAVDYDERDILEVLDHPLGSYLLSHMQSELPRLKNLTSWADVKVQDITKELLDRLSLRIAEREFKGKCELCKNWG